MNGSMINGIMKEGIRYNTDFYLKHGLCPEHYNAKGLVMVINREGHDDESGWLDAWEKCRGRNGKGVTVKHCVNAHCHSGHPDELVGAHVCKVKEPHKFYIVPLCYSCNNANYENKDYPNHDFLCVPEKYLEPVEEVEKYL